MLPMSRSWKSTGYLAGKLVCMRVLVEWSRRRRWWKVRHFRRLQKNQRSCIPPDSYRKSDFPDASSLKSLQNTLSTSRSRPTAFPVMDIPKAPLFFGHRESNRQDTSWNFCILLRPSATLSLMSPWFWIREMKLKVVVKLVFEKRRGEVPYYSIIHQRPNELR